MATNAAPNLSTHRPEAYATHASFVYSDKFTAPVLGLLNAQPGERIVDLGCGTGELTAKIRAVVGDGGYVLGIDSNTQMLSKFQGNNPHIDSLQADAQKLVESLDPALKQSFDAVFTSATLHWCNKDPAGVVEGVKWMLKPGGRFAFEFGGFGNVEGRRAASYDPKLTRSVEVSDARSTMFSAAMAMILYPLTLGTSPPPSSIPRPMRLDLTLTSQLVEQAGLIAGKIEIVPRPSPLNTDIIGWLETFARNSCFSHLSDKEARQYMEEVQEIVRPDSYWNDDTPGVGGGPVRDNTTQKGRSGWELMYVRLRGTATVPA